MLECWKKQGLYGASLETIGEDDIDDGGVLTYNWLLQMQQNIIQHLGTTVVLILSLENVFDVDGVEHSKTDDDAADDVVDNKQP